MQLQHFVSLGGDPPFAAICMDGGNAQTDDFAKLEGFCGRSSQVTSVD